MPPRQFLIRKTDQWVFSRETGEDGRGYTIKRVRSNLDDRTRESATRSLASEYEFLSKFNCPQLLRPIPAGSDPKTGVFRYEEVQGSIQQWAERRWKAPGDPINNDEVALILIDTLDGLTALHARRFGHGSLGLRSLLLTPEGRVKLGDFEGYTKSGYPNPTFQIGLRYQAPEILQGEPPANDDALAVADLYCLGYLAIELFAGSEFDRVIGFPRDLGGHQPAWLQWHRDLSQELDLTNKLKIAKGLSDVIDQLVRKLPDQRVWKTSIALRNHLQRKGIHANSALRPLHVPVPSLEDQPEDGPLPGIPWLQLTWLNRGKARPSLKVRDSMLVGKRDGCDFRLSDAPEISRKHALFARSGFVWRIYDLNSRTGLTLNGNPVSAKAVRLRAGAKIGIGPEELGVRLVLGDEARPFSEDFDYYDLPGYRLVRPLHRSDKKGDLLYLGYGVVSRDLRAIRVYSPESLLDQEWRRKFARFLKAARECQHPNVVRVYAAATIRFGGSNDTTLYLVTEYLPRGSLRDALRPRDLTPRRLSWERVARFGRDIGTALAAAADTRILHRNVNPGCILFAANGTAKLGDFSLVLGDVLEGYQQITTHNFTLVDQEYRAPEAIRGKPLDSSSDIYSLAACMHEAISGLNPFQRTTLPETLNAIETESPPPLRDFKVPPELAGAIDRALSKNPTDRFPSPRDFVAALPVEG